MSQSHLDRLNRLRQKHENIRVIKPQNTPVLNIVQPTNIPQIKGPTMIHPQLIQPKSNTTIIQPKQKQHYAIDPTSQTPKIIQTQASYAEASGKVVYVNSKNNSLFKIHAQKMNKDFRCICNFFCPVHEGDAVNGIVQMEQHPRYGTQLKFINPPFVVIAEDKDSILKAVLKSLRGTRFGNYDAHTFIDKMEERTGSFKRTLNLLDRMSGHWSKYGNDEIFTPYQSILSKSRFTKLMNWWYKNRSLRRLYLLGLTNGEIKRIDTSPEKIYEYCLTNPYSLPTLSMEKCDAIFQRLGKSLDDVGKDCATIVRKIQNYMDKNGWCGVPSKILSSNFPKLPELMPQLKQDFGIKANLFTIYLEHAYEVETTIAQSVAELITSPAINFTISEDNIISKRQLTSDQQKAVLGSLNSNISIINGPAGSGKTTVISEIAHTLDGLNINYRIVSFTGKAVARIREVIGRKIPSTMHRMIAGKQKINTFDHLIIDEASMVTTELLFKFMQKFNHSYKITLVGDSNQLEPIGWGSLFSQILKSNLVPVFNLKKIHRTKNTADNGIIINSNAIVEYAEEDYNGPPFEFTLTNNFNFMPGDISIVEKLIQGLHANAIPAEKITVISPFNCDLIIINRICQAIYNQDNRSVTDYKNQVWKIRDRVMMIENNYDINIMNGEEGIITDITETTVKVTFKDASSHEFDLHPVTLIDNNKKISSKDDGKKQLTTAQLCHSFAVSVHRSQGSEWNYVICYMPPGREGSKFLNRNLLYTAITRAKIAIWCVGDFPTFNRAATTAPPYRCDNLAQRISNAMSIDLTT